MNNCRLPEGMRNANRCSDCNNCGWNASVAKKRKDYMKTLGLTQDEKDGLKRLVIMPKEEYMAKIHEYIKELIERTEYVLHEENHDVGDELKKIVIELKYLTKAIASRNLPMIIKLASRRAQEKENGQESKSDIAG